MTQKSKLATSVPDEFLEILGAISVNFGALENALAFTIWALLGDLSVHNEERYQIVTAQLSVKQLVWMAEALYKQRFPGKDEDAMRALMARCSTAERERNKLIHSLWVSGDIKDSEQLALRLKITARSEFKFQHEQHTTKELTTVAEQCADLSDELRKFIIDVMMDEYEQQSAT